MNDNHEGQHANPMPNPILPLIGQIPEGLVQAEILDGMFAELERLRIVRVEQGPARANSSALGAYAGALAFAQCEIGNGVLRSVLLASLRQIDRRMALDQQVASSDERRGDA